MSNYAPKMVVLSIDEYNDMNKKIERLEGNIEKMNDQCFRYVTNRISGKGYLYDGWEEVEPPKYWFGMELTRADFIDYKDQSGNVYKVLSNEFRHSLSGFNIIELKNKNK